jgi:hypothetical protein
MRRRPNSAGGILKCPGDARRVQQVCQYMIRCVSLLPPPDDVSFLRTVHSIARVPPPSSHLTTITPLSAQMTTDVIWALVLFFYFYFLTK